MRDFEEGLLGNFKHYLEFLEGIMKGIVYMMFCIHIVVRSRSISFHSSHQRITSICLLYLQYMNMYESTYFYFYEGYMLVITEKQTPWDVLLDYFITRPSFKNLNVPF